jgi:hypothetical protein
MVDYSETYIWNGVKNGDWKAMGIGASRPVSSRIRLSGLTETRTSKKQNVGTYADASLQVINRIWRRAGNVLDGNFTFHIGDNFPLLTANLESASWEIDSLSGSYDILLPVCLPTTSTKKHDVVIVFDVSTSMADNMTEAKATATAIVALLGVTSRVSLITVADTATVVTHLTDSKSTTTTAISALTVSAEAETHLNLGAHAAGTELKDTSPSTDAVRHIVVISDGGDSWAYFGANEIGAWDCLGQTASWLQHTCKTIMYAISNTFLWEHGGMGANNEQTDFGGNLWQWHWGLGACCQQTGGNVLSVAYYATLLGHQVILADGISATEGQFTFGVLVTANQGENLGYTPGPRMANGQYLITQQNYKVKWAYDVTAGTVAITSQVREKAPPTSVPEFAIAFSLVDRNLPLNNELFARNVTAGYPLPPPFIITATITSTADLDHLRNVNSSVFLTDKVNTSGLIAFGTNNTTGRTFAGNNLLVDLHEDITSNTENVIMTMKNDRLAAGGTITQYLGTLPIAPLWTEWLNLAGMKPFNNYLCFSVGGYGQVNVEADWSYFPFEPQGNLTLSSTAIAATSITYNWTDVMYENYYQLFPAGSPTAFISNLGADLTTYQRTSLTPNTLYSTFCQAWSFGGILDSNTVSDYTLCNVPNNLIVAKDTGDPDHVIKISWEANSNPAGTIYQVRLYENADTTANEDKGAFIYSGEIYDGHDAEAHLTVSGLHELTPFYVKVRAVNHAGVSTAWTAAQTVTTEGTCLKPLPLSAVDYNGTIGETGRTISIRPTLVFQCPTSVDTPAYFHFKVLLDGANPPTTTLADSHAGTGGTFSYWDGTAWVAITTAHNGGVPNASFKNLIKFVPSADMTVRRNYWKVQSILNDAAGTHGPTVDADYIWSFLIVSSSWTQNDATHGIIGEGETVDHNAYIVKDVDLTEVRTELEYAQLFRGLTPESWVDPTITAHITRIRKVHIDQLRHVAEDIARASYKTIPTWTDTTITAGVTLIRDVHLEEIRSALAIAIM